MSFTQKELSLLNDEKSHEELSLDKYTKYANQACAPEAKELFNSIKQNEQRHLDTINQIIGGNIPQVQQNECCNMPAPKTANQNQQDKQSDKFYLQDAIETEKYMSGTYNTAIFEFQNGQVRDVLNQIQTEKQDVGYSVWQYMNANGMYN